MMSTTTLRRTSLACLTLVALVLSFFVTVMTPPTSAQAAPASVVTTVSPTVVEAEDGQISSGTGTTVVSAPSASGGKYVQLGTQIGEYNTITGIDGGVGGSAQVTIRYTYGAGGSNTKALYVNGVKVGNTQFASTSTTNDWTTWGEKTIDVPLHAGADNTIRFINEATTPYTLRLDKYTIVPAEPATYYVDSAAGNDANAGTDSAAPWKTLARVNQRTFVPGDQILLKSGSVWNGEGLVLKGSGTEAQPITLGRYGEGAKPQLNGNGQVTQLVFLRNLSWWTIEDLDITNTGAQDFVQTLMGVRIESIDAAGGLVSGITVQDIDVHNVNGVQGRGSVQFPALIYFGAGGNTTPSAFDRVLVKDSTT